MLGVRGRIARATYSGVGNEERERGGEGGRERESHGTHHPLSISGAANGTLVTRFGFGSPQLRIELLRDQVLQCLELSPIT